MLLFSLNVLHKMQTDTSLRYADILASIIVPMHCAHIQYLYDVRTHIHSGLVSHCADHCHVANSHFIITLYYTEYNVHVTAWMICHLGCQSRQYRKTITMIRLYTQYTYVHRPASLTFFHIRKLESFNTNMLRLLCPWMDPCLLSR